MSHEFESGFGARKAAWHGLMTVVENELTAAEAIKAAGMEFFVQKVPLYLPRFKDNEEPVLSGVVGDEDHIEYVPANDVYAVIRQDTGLVLGSVGNQYECFQNVDAFSFMDKAIGEGLASFHTAGVLKGGRHIWIQCRLPGHLGSDLDPVEKFFTISTAHDGSRAVNVMMTPTRVVCWNTLNMAWGNKKGFSMRHSRNIGERIIDAQRLIADAEERLDEFDNQIKAMQSTAFSDDQFRALITNLMPPPEDAKCIDDVPTVKIKAWDKMFACFKSGRGADLVTAKSTAWGAVNAIAEYTDWERTTRGGGAGQKQSEDVVLDATQHENRFRAHMWGSGARLKQHAADLVVEYVEKGPDSQWAPTTEGSLAEDLLLGD